MKKFFSLLQGQCLSNFCFAIMENAPENKVFSTTQLQPCHLVFAFDMFVFTIIVIVTMVTVAMVTKILRRRSRRDAVGPAICGGLTVFRPRLQHGALWARMFGVPSAHSWFFRQGLRCGCTGLMISGLRIGAAAGILWWLEKYIYR